MSNPIHIKVKIGTRKDGNYLHLIGGKQVVDKCVKKYLLDSGKSEITLEGMLSEKIEYKSPGQLGYYFGVIVPHIMVALDGAGFKGMNEKHVDEFLRRKFLTISVANEITGDVLEYTKELSSLFKDDMTRFINSCVSFAQEDLSYYIPKKGENEAIR